MGRTDDPVLTAIEDAAACQSDIRESVTILLARLKNMMSDADLDECERIIEATWRTQDHIQPLRGAKLQKTEDKAPA